MGSGKILVISGIWIVIVALVAVSVKFFLFPTIEAKQEVVKKEQEKQKIIQTSSESHYKIQLDFGLDSFSGYSVLRSSEFKNQIAQKKIKVNLIDDNADYPARLAKLKSGELQMATFTIDALLKASSKMGDMPATIVAICDETRGADGVVAYKSVVPNVDSINDAQMKFVLTPDSPSETLARVLISHFGLKDVSPKNFIYAKDAEDVYKRYRASKAEDKQIYILWEPYISKMLENPNISVVVDSSRFRGYIVDVIVVSRDFLFKNPEVVKDFIQSYFQAVYAYARKDNGITNLVLDDSRTSGQPLSNIQADRLVKGIWWKNTQENFAHFGLNNDKPLQHIEDMILNISNVLVSTNAIVSDPTNGKPNVLYYDKLLVSLKDANFHPVEGIRKDSDKLPELNTNQWNDLIPVGTLDVPQIVFARGTSLITDQSKITLDELNQKLKSWPQYYLTIRGNASLQGDIEANRLLALNRAKSVEQYLLDNGISKTRVRAISVDPTGSTSVSFQLGYMSY